MLLVLIFFLPASVHRSDVFSKFRLSIWIVVEGGGKGRTAPWGRGDEGEPQPALRMSAIGDTTKA